MHALQEAEGDAAVANPGFAYGASALGPSAGGGAGAAPGNADAQAGTGAESAPSQPLQNGDAAANGASENGSEQQGLSLPFDPVALVFKDIHYFVKRPDNKSEELELLKVPGSLLLLLLLAAVFLCSLLTTLLLKRGSVKTAMACFNCLLECVQGLMPADLCMQWLVVFVCENVCKHNTISKALWVHFATTSDEGSVIALPLMYMSLYGRALQEPSGLVC